MFTCKAFWVNCWNIAQIDSALDFYSRDAGAVPAVPLIVTRLCGFLFWIGGEDLSLSILTG